MLGRKRLIAIVLSVCLCLTLCLSACDMGGGKSGGDSAADSTATSTYQGDYDIRLTAIGSTTIKAGKTVQIRASITGTADKDVTFTSDNESVATVSATGLVTGIAQGETLIWCSLNIEPNCKKSIKVTIENAVVPEALTIKGADSDVQWVGESAQLSVEVTPAEASGLVTWDSSDKAVATVSESGLVEFLTQGTVTITAVSNEKSDVTVSKTFTVKAGVFRSDLGSPYWDISDQCADINPNVELNIDRDKLGYHSCYFANALSTRYYVEVTFTIKEQISTWVWQGIGLGSGLSETSTRYFIFSPRVEGQGNDFNKFIVKDLPNETWPAITTRSQTWGENGLNNIDWKNSPVKIGMLRDGNTYYYLITDKLMYVDENTVYDDVPTMPILISVDIPVIVKNYTVLLDNNAIDAQLTGEQFKKSFFASDPERVEYESDNKFIFKSTNILSKDHKVRSLGDKAKVVGSFEIEFDVTDLTCNKAHTAGMSGITLNLSRYDSADTVETFMVGSSVEQQSMGFNARYLSWNYTMSMDNANAPYFWSESSASVFDNAAVTHHVKVTRTVADNMSTFRMWVDGNEVTFDVLSSKYNTMTSRYTGAYTIWVGGEYASCEVTNFTFKSNM